MTFAGAGFYIIFSVILILSVKFYTLAEVDDLVGNGIFSVVILGKGQKVIGEQLKKFKEAREYTEHLPSSI